MKELFDITPKTKQRRPNPLPIYKEDAAEEKVVGTGRFPPWLHRKLPKGGNLHQTGVEIDSKRLHTVCEEAKCPNRLECYSKKTATFLALGKECTRNCGFCSITYSATPKPLEADEPMRIALSAKQLGLKHVVVTMVARDDLPDGGAAHIAAIIREIRAQQPQATVEVLTSDFSGNESAYQVVIEAHPEIFNYNIETVRELTPRVRHKATYDRTLSLLRYIKEHSAYILIKSGLMVGLGETESQVHQTLIDLKNSGCDIVTIGQYLQPSRHQLLVKAFIHPDQFAGYEAFGKSIGIKHLYCGPFVRSSYNADQILKNIRSQTVS